ncbi:hypothetical protein [Effusibacillus lacus]|uniref:hypothetical protein n=1 Tax=Effusibacillus lacus TaxID=1348429 RepID=UPI001051E518|nr:hypothetical protein [Effusibacillus lacus]TCS75729.1 hypothetical protein EDD64_106105 [Effusibacillus lacus]
MLQEEDSQSIAADLESDDELREMIEKSLEAYERGDYMTTSESIKSLSKGFCIITVISSLEEKMTVLF